jgi:probable F420-dependent oxidoreductase
MEIFFLVRAATTSATFTRDSKDFDYRCQVCDTRRMNLSKYGVWIGHTLLEHDYGEAATLAEDLGFGTFWLGGSPRLSKVRGLLEASQNLVIATGIVNIWQYDPAVLAAEFADLERDFPGRVLLGLGIGHPEGTVEYQKPLTKTKEFLDGIAAAPAPVPRERMVVAALGPKMLDLSFERTLGTHPYYVPAEQTRIARQRLGSEALVATEIAVVVDEDRERGLAAARKYSELYLQLSNYTSNLKRLGWAEEDLADGGSTRLMDAVVPQGSAADLVGPINAHLDAGADHVCVQTVGVNGLPTAAWTALAGALGLGSA